MRWAGGVEGDAGEDLCHLGLGGAVVEPLAAGEVGQVDGQHGQ